MTQGVGDFTDKLGQAFAKLRKSSFIKNLFIVISGTALGQVVSYALSPVISRLYSPVDFGIYGSFSTALQIVGALITLDYYQAIMIPKDNDEAWGLFLLSCLTTIVIGAGFFLFCLIFPNLIQNVIKAPQAWILGLFVLGIFLIGIALSLQAWCVRIKAFKTTSASQVIRGLTNSGTQLGLGYIGGGAPALISGTILGELFATVNLAKVVARDRRVLHKARRRNNIWKLAKEYRDFPFYSASANVINTFSTGLPIFLLARYYGIATAGAYAFGIRIAAAPMDLVTRALRLVLYQKAAETHNYGGSLFSLYIKFTGGLFALSLVPAMIIIIWAPAIFSWVFGAQWRLAGVFARGIIIWLVFMFCALPANLCARIVRMQRQLLLYNVIVLILRTLVLIVGGLYMSSATTVIMFSLVGAVMNIVLISVIGLALKRRESDMGWKKIFDDLKGAQ